MCILTFIVLPYSFPCKFIFVNIILLFFFNFWIRQIIHFFCLPFIPGNSSSSALQFLQKLSMISLHEFVYVHVVGDFLRVFVIYWWACCVFSIPVMLVRDTLTASSLLIFNSRIVVRHFSVHRTLKAAGDSQRLQISSFDWLLTWRTLLVTPSLLETVNWPVWLFVRTAVFVGFVQLSLWFVLWFVFWSLVLTVVIVPVMKPDLVQRDQCTRYQHQLL